MVSHETETWLLIEIIISLRKDIIYYGANVIYLTYAYILAYKRM